jgi:hypothetical protein
MFAEATPQKTVIPTGAQRSGGICFCDREKQILRLRSEPAPTCLEPGMTTMGGIAEFKRPFPHAHSRLKKLSLEVRTQFFQDAEQPLARFLRKRSGQ